MTSFRIRCRCRQRRPCRALADRRCEIGRVAFDDERSIDAKIAASVEAFRKWREVPAPRRGELVRLFGEELRANKDALGRLVTIENGKILQEGLGEVQEMIDICDFAVGLSRQLYGLTIASERPGHRMMEQWHPAGPVAVISAFNFPVAVWAWNAALAFVCGDPRDLETVGEDAAHRACDPGAVRARGETLRRRAASALADRSRCARSGRGAGARPPHSGGQRNRLDARWARRSAPVVASRFGRSILELGGNNAMIVCPSAKLDLALRAILFAAVGTAGQRCTTLRRLFVHEFDLRQTARGAESGLCAARHRRSARRRARWSVR